MSDRVCEVFQLLCDDSDFIARLETSIANIMKDNKVDQYDVPEFIFIITDALATVPFKVNSKDLPVLIKLLYNFMVDKLNLIPQDKRSDFERLVDSALKLLMLQPVVSSKLNNLLSKITSCIPCCKPANTTNTTNQPVQQKSSDAKSDDPLPEIPASVVQVVKEAEVVVQVVKEAEAVVQVVKEAEAVVEAVKEAEAVVEVVKEAEAVVETPVILESQ